MCDYSLASVASRPAEVGEHLITKHFISGTTGFAPASGEEVAVCVLPGTEIAFDEDIVAAGGPPRDLLLGVIMPLAYTSRFTKVGRFRQVKKDEIYAHHDALELPGGEIVMLNWLKFGQKATVLQLPAAPKTAEEAKEQQRLVFAG